MTFAASSLLEHYESLINEYRTDLERNLDLAAGSASDPFGAMDRINRYLISEIARLKVQLIDIDLKLAQLPAIARDTGIKPRADDAWASMPVYDAGSFVSVGAGVTTYGFHSTEVADGGFIHRWAGPSTRSGFVALINRGKPLVAEISNVKMIDPRIVLLKVAVDGEAVRTTWHKNQLRFVIPALRDSVEPVPTQISFFVNESVVINEVQPQFADHRRVSFNMAGVQLLRYTDEL